jgi:hypothetical protein
MLSGSSFDSFKRSPDDGRCRYRAFGQAAEQGDQRAHPALRLPRRKAVEHATLRREIHGAVRMVTLALGGICAPIPVSGAMSLRAVTKMRQSPEVLSRAGE